MIVDGGGGDGDDDDNERWSNLSLIQVQESFEGLL
jgi:hypothetical protein